MRDPWAQPKDGARRIGPQTGVSTDNGGHGSGVGLGNLFQFLNQNRSKVVLAWTFLQI
jgi:hypothetical protein